MCFITPCLWSTVMNCTPKIWIKNGSHTKYFYHRRRGWASWGGTDMFITFTVVMVSEMRAYLQVYPDVHIKCTNVGLFPSPHQLTSPLLSVKMKYTSSQMHARQNNRFVSSFLVCCCTRGGESRVMGQYGQGRLCGDGQGL